MDLVRTGDADDQPDDGSEEWCQNMCYSKVRRSQWSHSVHGTYFTTSRRWLVLLVSQIGWARIGILWGWRCANLLHVAFARMRQAPSSPLASCLPTWSVMRRRQNDGTCVSCPILNSAAISLGDTQEVGEMGLRTTRSRGVPEFDVVCFQSTWRCSLQKMISVISALFEKVRHQIDFRTRLEAPVDLPYRQRSGRL